eukprot:g3205.t1
MSDLAIALANGPAEVLDPVNLTVSIPSYELQNGWSGRIAYYKIVSTDGDSGLTSTVLKRFNTFFDLKEALEEKYKKDKDFKLPKLPAKRWKVITDHADPDFLTERRYSLQNFLRRLCEKPKLGRDSLVRKFLKQ